MGREELWSLISPCPGKKNAQLGSTGQDKAEFPTLIRHLKGQK